jgi:hypothetical protein
MSAFGPFHWPYGPNGPKGVKKGSKTGHFGPLLGPPPERTLQITPWKMRDLAQNSSKPVKKGVPEWPLGGVLGPPQTPDPLIGHRLLSISSVILDPQGPWEGSKMTHFGVPPKSPFWRVRAETRV